MEAPAFPLGSGRDGPFLCAARPPWLVDWGHVDAFSYLGEVIAGSVAELRGRHLAHPAQLTSGEWDEILDQIVEGFKAAVRRDELPADHPHWVVLEIKRQRAFELLNKWWYHLWD